MEVNMSRPVLARGSTGRPVKLVQVALNAAGGSHRSQLAPDGVFGPKTDERVREFQRLLDLIPDGVVGPLTYKELESVIKIVETILDFAPRPEDEAAARARIVAQARALFASHGWSVIDPARTLTSVGVNNPRILAKVAAGPQPQRPGTFFRQGGAALAGFFHMAGANKPEAGVTISDVFRKKYGALGPGNTKIQAKLDNQDLPSWCGIFANAIYRMVGLKTSPWREHGGLKVFGADREFSALSGGARAQPGDIGVEDGFGGLNHHFIVVGSVGDVIETVEGNAGHIRNAAGFSEIVMRFDRPAIAPKNNKILFFLSPIMAKLLRP
jgi:Putative peptidoglycan binding domain